MTLMSVPVLVALAPALVSTLACIVINLVPVLKSSWKKHQNSSATIEWAKDLAWTVALLGSAVAGTLGYSEESTATVVMAVAWFFVFAAIAKALTVRLSELAEMKELKDRAVQHRKLAGTVRSIVRSELAKVSGTKKDDLGS